MKTLKRIIIGIISIIALLYLADMIWKAYSRSNVNSHEAIVLINNHLTSDDIDFFFNLEKGTFNPTEHMIIFSLRTKDGHVLDYYKNLPVRNKYSSYNNIEFDCDVEYESVRGYGFYNYQIGNENIIARIIEKNATVERRLNQNQIITEKHLGIIYQFGKINVLDINKNGITQRCL